MKAENWTAICATGIALISLMATLWQARATRKHARLTLRPLLEFEFRRRPGQESGLFLSNWGNGPAIIRTTSFSLDGQPIGTWEAPEVNKVRESLRTRPIATTLRPGKVLRVGYDRSLLALAQFDYERDSWFWELISKRMSIEVVYDSLYGGEGFRVSSDTVQHGAATSASTRTIRGLSGSLPDERKPEAPGAQSA